MILLMKQYQILNHTMEQVLIRYQIPECSLELVKEFELQVPSFHLYINPFV